MSPILDSIGSVKAYGWGSFVAVAPPAFESIATVSVGSGGQAYAEFTVIPSTYKHLQIRAIAKVVNNNAIAVNGLMQFNSDTGSNYARHLLDGNGSSASASGSSNQTSIVVCPFPDNNLSTLMFGSFVLDIPDYANTSKYKTIRSLSAYEMNNATYGAIRLYSGLWKNTNAITSIKIYGDGKNLDQYSSFALYGIKGVE